jgi:hypothetical protein
MRGRRQPPMALPMHVAPPTREEVEASAKASPLVATLSRLRDYVGPGGRQLSPAHGLRFDSGEVLAEILGLATFPDPDESTGDAGTLWPHPAPRCTLAFAIAIECGAIEEVGDRLVPSALWDLETTIVQASVALSTLIELGPLWTSMSRGEPFFDLRDSTLDDTYVTWLATLLPAGQEQHVDHFVNWGIDVCRELIGIDPFDRCGEFDLWIDNGTSYLIDTLEWAGAIEWSGRQLQRHELVPNARWLGGGSIRLTALGRHVLPDHLADVGLKLREPDEPGSQPAVGLIGDVLVADQSARRDLVAAWRRELDDADRARLVAEVLLEATYAPWRIAGFEVLELIGADVAAPYVRQLLDSPSSEAAAQFLVTHGLADRDEVEPFVGYGPLIDALASVATRPDQLRTWFVRLLERTEAPELLLEVIALYPTPEATMVLTAAARHVTDPRFADLVVAAEQYHHEWLANRDPAL